MLQHRYRLDRLIGAGTTARVWQGHDELLHRPVAVRLLREDRASLADRFLTEGRAAARLTHANVAAVYDVGISDDGMPYIIMELLDGPTLADRGELPWWELTRAGAEVGAALAHAHGQWVTHGALTADKVVLTDVGAKVFGFTDRRGSDEHDLTPDVYALGHLLRAALAQSGDPDDTPPPAQLATLLGRCLDPDPAARPGSDQIAYSLSGLIGSQVDLPAWYTHAVGPGWCNEPAPAAARPAQGRFGRTGRLPAAGMSALSGLSGRAATAGRHFAAAFPVRHPAGDRSLLTGRPSRFGRPSPSARPAVPDRSAHADRPTDPGRPPVNPDRRPEPDPLPFDLTDLPAVSIRPDRSDSQPREGLPREGQPREGQPREGQRHEGLPREGLPREGLPREGLPREGQPREGQRHEGQPREGQPREGQPREGQPREGQPREGLSQHGLSYEGGSRGGRSREDLSQEHRVLAAGRRLASLHRAFPTVRLRRADMPAGRSADSPSDVTMVDLRKPLAERPVTQRAPGAQRGTRPAPRGRSRAGHLRSRRALMLRAFAALAIVGIVSLATFALLDQPRAEGTPRVDTPATATVGPVSTPVCPAPCTNPVAAPPTTQPAPHVTHTTHPPTTRPATHPPTTAPGPVPGTGTDTGTGTGTGTGIGQTPANPGPNGSPSGTPSETRPPTDQPPAHPPTDPTTEPTTPPTTPPTADPPPPVTLEAAPPATETSPTVATSLG